MQIRRDTYHTNTAIVLLGEWLNLCGVMWPYTKACICKNDQQIIDAIQ